MVHIDLAGPYEAFMDGSLYLIVFDIQRFGVDTTVRHEEEVGEHYVRADVPRENKRHGATALVSDRQRWGVHWSQFRRILRLCWDSPWLQVPW